ncbi:MAG: malto-oligosyltrehalose synthase [Desulfobulbaceae bacterium]|nr:MAG: malto-oligosyltrehalose synthase [Desulfobulbaceae bacterium]
MDNAAFQQLCMMMGIGTVSLDGAESEAMPGEAAQLAFLRALGVIPHTGVAAGAELEELLCRQYEQMVRPVVVLGEYDGPAVVTLRLADEELASPVIWQLTEEGGDVHEGTADPLELERLDTALARGKGFTTLRLPIGLRLPMGYHRFRIACGDDPEEPRRAESLLIVAPARCYTPPDLPKKGRIWGLSCQLENVRSRRNWGCGDLTDLESLLGWAAEIGAGTLAVSCLLPTAEKDDAALMHFLPSSRNFTDPLFLDPEAVADYHESAEARAQVGHPGFQVRLAQLRDAKEVDREEIMALKNEVTETLWRHFQLNHLNPESERGRSFRQFQETGGALLQSFALYQALRGHWRESGGKGGDVAGWPYQDRGSPAVAAFAESNRDRIEFHQYLQWQLELQLAAAGQRSLELGLKVGLTMSLPIGVDPHGSAVWHQPSLFALPLTIHDCPGDAGCIPHGPPEFASMASVSGCEAFLAALRANMHYAGALRFSSIHLLDRQLWRPGGHSDGPAWNIVRNSDDLLAVIALESWRNRCLVIGEHREPLSEQFAGTLDTRGILVSRPGFFVTDWSGDWLEPARYPAQSVVTASRYDLCSLEGYWRGSDIALLSSRCPDFSDRYRERAIVARAAERARLLVALSHENLLPHGVDLDPAGVPDLSPALIRAVYAFLCRTPARILLVQLADLVSMAEQDRELPAPHSPAAMARLTADLEFLRDDEGLRLQFREYCLERAVGVVRPSALLGDRRRRQTQELPHAFYRLQFSRDFTFLQAASLLPYLRDLGISHCYASPYLKARPGSSHGYDIIDHQTLNPEIGSREEYEAFVAALDDNGLAQILDMVPNHMGVGPDNRWWLDVLENGQASPYATFFDINWQLQDEELKNRVLLPVLGDYFGTVLEEGKLRLVFRVDRGCFEIACYEQCYPVAPNSYPRILGHDLPRLELRLGSQHEGFLELQNLIASFAGLPGSEESDPERLEMRNRNKEVLKRLLARLCREVPEIAGFLEENVLLFNGEPGKPESFNLLEQLLANQAYRLAFWRVASDEINYRRFFDINDLAGLRMERREVFEQTHRLVLDLIATGKVDGLRLDHPDGLYNPEQYFRNLQAAVGGVAPEQMPPPAAAGGLPGNGHVDLPLYVVVEKILSDREQLPGSWMVHGTTGYDFSSLVNGLFVDRTAEEAMTAGYQDFVGYAIDFVQLAHDCRRLIIKSAMAGEINVLSNHLHRLAKHSRYTQDYTLNGLRGALTEIVASFPVYRTYCTADGLTAVDRRHVEQAVDLAKANCQAEDTSIYDFIRSVFLLERRRSGEQQDAELVDFVMKFQQYTGPVMAKGLEDTAFYIYNRLVSLNEVGDDPRRFGRSVEDFHIANRARCEQRPLSMLNTGTHDSKRSEDVRARIDVLSEMAPAWLQAVERWHGMNSCWKTAVGQELAPSKNDEYALYQNLLGVWPLEPLTAEGLAAFCDRFTGYMMKVAREAKVHTSWLNQNHAYESAMSHFIDRLFGGDNQAFLDDFLSFHRQTSRFGMLNSLSQLLLRLTAPGIPDTFQGNETWQFSLVDPDNRRPVDFAARREMLASLQGWLADASNPMESKLQELLNNRSDGRIKMYILWKTMAFRRENPRIFSDGSYLPLQAEGEAGLHICAFARISGRRAVIAAVPRLVTRLLHGDPECLPLGAGVWGATTLALPSEFRGWRTVNVLTGEDFTNAVDTHGNLLAADLFRRFPVALVAMEHEVN